MMHCTHLPATFCGSSITTWLCRVRRSPTLAATPRQALSCISHTLAGDCTLVTPMQASALRARLRRWRKVRDARLGLCDRLARRALRALPIARRHAGASLSIASAMQARSWKSGPRRSRARQTGRRRWRADWRRATWHARRPAPFRRMCKASSSKQAMPSLSTRAVFLHLHAPWLRARRQGRVYGSRRLLVPCKQNSKLTRQPCTSCFLCAKSLELCRPMITVQA